MSTRAKLLSGSVALGAAAAWALKLIYDGFVDVLLWQGAGGDEAVHKYLDNFANAGSYIAPVIGLMIAAGVYLTGSAIMRREEPAAS